jgi:hypothetical protein
MATVERDREFNVSADDLWKKIGDFARIDEWASGIEKLELSDAGKTRTITVGGGATITERLLEEGDRSYTYSLDAGGAMPVVGYRSTLAVAPNGADGCIVHWRGEFDPAEGTPEEVAVQIIGMVYDAGLAGMEKAVS